MGSFKIILTTDEIKLGSKWSRPSNIESLGKLVDKKGLTVGSDWTGRKYQIVEEREHIFCTFERFGRGVLGVVTIICTLFLAIISKSVRDLFTQKKETIRFAILVNPPTEINLPKGFNQKIEECFGTQETRKKELQAAAKQFQALILRAKTQGMTYPQVYIMEGATQENEVKGRPSSDPDENLALAMIAGLTQVIQQISIIAVPDAPNVEHTIQFFNALGVQAEKMDATKVQLKPGTIYVVPLDDEDLVRHVQKTTPKGGDLILLGPALHHADLLVADEGSIKQGQVTIMGEIKTTKDTHGVSRLEGKSTNTDPLKGTNPNFIKALQDSKTGALRSNVGCFSSNSMVEANVNLNEVSLLNPQGALLFTSKDRKFWAKNTQEQFLSALTSTNFNMAPSLFGKRLVNSHVSAFFANSEEAKAKIEEIKASKTKLTKRVLSFESWIKLVGSYSDDGALNPKTLNQFTLQAEMGFVDWSDNASVHNLLIEFIGKFQTDHPVLKTDGDLAESLASCTEEIGRMSSVQKKVALAGIAAALKSIYTDKTVEGWKYAMDQNLNPLFFNSFEKAYIQAGKQVPYDANVCLAHLDPEAKLPENSLKRVYGDMVLLALTTPPEDWLLP